MQVQQTSVEFAGPNTARISGVVVRVFRGPLRPGEPVVFSLAVVAADGSFPMGGPWYGSSAAGRAFLPRAGLERVRCFEVYLKDSQVGGDGALVWALDGPTEGPLY